MSLFTYAKAQDQSVESMVRAFLATHTVTHIESKADREAKRKAVRLAKARRQMEKLEKEASEKEANCA